MAQIKKDKRNYRVHPEKNKRLIRKSLEDLGAGRSILIDKDDNVIAGNGVFEQAEALNIPIRVIETNGNELIAVKRTDISEDDEKRKQLALLDNHATDTSEFDLDLISQDFSEEFLKSISMDIKEVLEDIQVDNPDYPLIPMYDEKYNAFVIICKTKTEEARVRTLFNLAYRAKSYKKQFLGETYVIDSKELK
jgi:hypothetical protein